MSVTRDWSWPSPPHNPQPPRVCCNTLTRSQIQEQEGSSGAMQSRDRVMELLIRLEPPLSSQSSEQGVCLCVCLGLSRNSWREPSLEIKAWLWVCVCSDNVIYKKKKKKNGIQNGDSNLLFHFKTNTLKSDKSLKGHLILDIVYEQVWLHKNTNCPPHHRILLRVCMSVCVRTRQVCTTQEICTPTCLRLCVSVSLCVCVCVCVSPLCAPPVPEVM